MNILSFTLQGNFPEDYIDFLKTVPKDVSYTEHCNFFSEASMETPSYFQMSHCQRGCNLFSTRAQMKSDFIFFLDRDTGLYFVDKNRVNGEGGWKSYKYVRDLMDKMYSEPKGDIL